MRAALLAWYRARRRDLPWRGIDDPYAIWISEVMLQQTQVATALPYFARWMDRFPDVASLAAAPLDQVLSAWQGLGYYARARNLHAAAQTVVEALGGQLPTTFAGLRALPGIGEYTAAALASIAYGEPVAAVDGNVERVMARLYGIADDVGRAAGRRAIREAAARWVVGPSPGDVNQALMELGATVCTPRRPDCAACPVAACCIALATGRANALPVKARATAARRVDAIAWLIRSADGRWLVGRRPERGLLGGLWEFPLTHVAGSQSVAGSRGGLGRPAADVDIDVDALAAGGHLSAADRRALASLARARLGVDVTDLALLPVVVHAFSHLRLRVVPIVGAVAGGGPGDLGVAETAGAYWLPDVAAGDAAYEALAWSSDADIEGLPASTFVRRLVAATKATSEGPVRSVHLDVDDPLEIQAALAAVVVGAPAG